MKKNILLFASLIASVFVAGSCQKYEVKEAVDENATVSSFTVKATLGATSGEGMKTTIAADDVLRVRFTDDEGNTFGRIQTLYNTTGAGASATFSATSVAVPNGAKKFIVFLDSRASGKINFGTTPTTADFTKQDGTLKSAQGLQMIMGVGEIANEASVTLAYATSIVKAELSFPEGVTPVIGETTITLAVNEFNKMVIANNNDDSKYTTGNLTVNAVVDTVKKTASAYIALVSQDGNLKKGTIFSEFGGTKYGCDVNGEKIEPGKTFSVKEKTEVMVYSFKYDSEAQTIDNVSGEIASSDATWVTLSGGKLLVSENTTGKYRKGSILMNTGKTYMIEQAQYKPADFTGTYSFYSYSFNAFYTTTTPIALGMTYKINQSNREHKTTVKFVTVDNPVEKNGHIHNLDLVGLYKDFKLPVSIEFTENGPVVNMYLSKDFQTVTGGDEMAAIPELTNSTSYATGYFAPLTFGVGDCNYCWIGWGIDTTNNRITLGTGDQRKVSDNRWFCGFSFCKKGYSGSNTSYSTIYQLNYKNKWVFDITSGGAYFQKEVDN